MVGEGLCQGNAARAVVQGACARSPRERLVAVGVHDLDERAAVKLVVRAKNEDRGPRRSPQGIVLVIAVNHLVTSCHKSGPHCFVADHVVHRSMSDEARISDLAQTCVSAVQRALGFELDYTQDTLPILDHYLEGLSADEAVRRTKPEIIDLVAPMCGAYFGEVIRMHIDAARWHAPESEYGLYRLEFERCFLHFNPVGVIVEAILKGEADGWAAHLQMLDQDRPAVERSLRAVGDVRDDDYYRLGVRFEVVEQVHRVVSSAALARGDETLHYSHEVYEAASETGVVPGDGTLQ